MFEKRYSMSSNYPVVSEPQVQFNHNDLNELINKQNLKMPPEVYPAFLLRFSPEIEKAAQDAMVATIQSLLANPHVANTFKVEARAIPELKDVKLSTKVAQAIEEN